MLQQKIFTRLKYLSIRWPLAHKTTLRRTVYGLILLATGGNMAIQTTQQQLERVQQAIQQIECGAQSASIDGINYTQANLDVLYRREEMLFKRLSVRNLRKRTIPEFS